MTEIPIIPDKLLPHNLTRRNTLGLIAATTGSLLLPNASHTLAATSPSLKENIMEPKAFVYTEVQISVAFDKAPWKNINAAIKEQPGFLNKTWFSGVNTNSLGGIYSFDSIENAQLFVTGYFPSEAAGFGAAHNTRVFDATVVKEASIGMGSPHFGELPNRNPGAFVYTEVQINLPFENAPWKARNPILRQQNGLLAKTWLSGLHTNTIGGVDVFDTVENAHEFAVKIFPETAKKLNAAFYTRVFDARLTEEASREMDSPYYV